jgi:16S rRNA (cytosine1402-N4)-methyltransferase
MSIHKPVLLNETVNLMNLKPDSIVVDATLGGGGHSREILKKIKNGKLIAIDADNEAIKNFETGENIFLVNENFVNLENILADLKIEKVDAVLADLGWSSDQLEGKGMSFRKDEPLDMRLDMNQELSAKKIVNEYGQTELENIIKNYGEERFWKNIAKKIIEYRKVKKIETTKELACVISDAVPSKYKFDKINPATRTFQALRIETNNELENLKKFIPVAIKSLNFGGRLAIISFHSLEDRIVKNSFRENARGCIFTDPITGQKTVEDAPVIKIISRKPVTAGEKEIKDNSRARSAKLRVCEKIVR